MHKKYLVVCIFIYLFCYTFGNTVEWLSLMNAVNWKLN